MMKFLVIGDSFVKRLGEFVEQTGIGAPVVNNPVLYFDWGGSTIDGICSRLS